MTPVGNSQSIVHVDLTKDNTPIKNGDFSFYGTARGASVEYTQTVCVLQTVSNSKV